MAQTTHWEGCEAVHFECKTELERKSNAIQRLWKERDELRALNAELVKALKGVLEVWQDDPAYGHGAIDKAWELLVKVEASK